MSTLELNDIFLNHNGYLSIQDKLFNWYQIARNGRNMKLYTKMKGEHKFKPTSLSTCHINPIFEFITNGFNLVCLTDFQEKPLQYFENVTIDEVPFPED